MNELLIIIGCSSSQRMLPAYLQSLKQAGIDTHVESGLNIENIASGGSLAWSLGFQRNMAEAFSHYRKIVFTDAFDMMFFGTKDEVLAKIPDEGIVMGAERNCYPNIGLRDAMPGTSPWRFANGGFLAGTPKALGSFLFRVSSHPLYLPGYLNQEFYNLLLHAGCDWVRLDTRTELCYCVFLENGELDFEDGLPVNTMFGTRPNFIHCNNHSEGAIQGRIPR